MATIAGAALIQRWEQCRLESYKDGGGVWTIGWGTTVYPTGARVGPDEHCTQAEADAWFTTQLAVYAAQVDALTVDSVTPNQLDALTSFAYNEGVGAYRGSHLRVRVNANPNDPAIRGEFMKWFYDNHVPSLGLWRRRHAEADNYFGVATLCPDLPHPIS